MNWQVFGILGWCLVFIGWSLQRRSVQHALKNFNLQIGSGNQSSVTQTQTNHVKDEKSKNDSPLMKASSWATIGGLFVSAYPIVKDWLK